MDEKNAYSLDPEKLRGLVHITIEQAIDGVLWFDAEGWILGANNAACKLLRYTKEELLKLSVVDIDADFTIEKYKSYTKQSKKSKAIHFQSHHRRRDGTRYVAEITVYYIEFERLGYSCAFFRDITERKRREERLRQALNESEQMRNRLQAENIYLQEEVQLGHNFRETIGRSRALKKVLLQVEQVAPSDSTVLILGETGTGKELVARAVHYLSERRERPLVKVNCATLPVHLIESDLFGHEKGAFTGALNRKVGKFELANGGTIFLDEIGELPKEMQVKLLRVLQEGEFERLGNPKMIKVDVRVIAATNRDLEQMVRANEFRRDLYYRLNVYPIHCPPLRERRSDVPLLVKHFLKKHGSKIGKTIEHVPSNVMNVLKSYQWPGNVRELENIIQRALIISRRDSLEIGNLPLLIGQETNEQAVPTLCELETKHINEVLETTSWRVSGKGGAAERLGLKPTTLEARMKKLGIKRNR